LGHRFSLLARVEGCTEFVCSGSEPDKKLRIWSRKLSPSGTGDGGTGGFGQTVGAVAQLASKSVTLTSNLAKVRFLFI
jgi:hypothetical protein